MTATKKIKCNCGGDLGVVVHEAEGRFVECLNCGHKRKMLSRTSPKREKLEALVAELIAKGD